MPVSELVAFMNFRMNVIFLIAQTMTDKVTYIICITFNNLGNVLCGRISNLPVYISNKQHFDQVSGQKCPYYFLYSKQVRY